MELEIRPIENGDDQYEAWTKPMGRTLGFDLSLELPLIRHQFEIDRALGVFDKGEIVATIHVFSLDMRVPGNVLPMAA